MLNGNEFLRYSRQIMLPDIAEQGQQRLKEAKVLIVGMGGLGCPVALYLNAAGIGKLILADDDVIETSNLQRQILYRDGDRDCAKVEIAAQRLRENNPHTEIEAAKVRVDSQWLAIQAVDIIVDCSDNHKTRTLINRHCFQHRLPWVMAAVGAWEGRVADFLFNSELLNAQLHPCYNCWQPAEAEEVADNCNSLGVVGPLLGLVGSMQAMSVIRLLTQNGSHSHGQVNCIDSKSNRSYNLKITKRKDCSVCGNKFTTVTQE